VSAAPVVGVHGQLDPRLVEVVVQRQVHREAAYRLSAVLDEEVSGALGAVAVDHPHPLTEDGRGRPPGSVDQAGVLDGDVRRDRGLVVDGDLSQADVHE
jgi:hypothetical protein